MNFRRLKLWTVGSFGIPGGTAQYSGYITTKGCVRLQRATRSGSMMQETPSAFLFPPPEAEICKCRDLCVHCTNNQASNWKTGRRIYIRAEGSSEERLQACGRANQRILGVRLRFRLDPSSTSANRAETAGTAPSLPHPTMKHRDRRHQPISCLRGSNPSSHNNNNKDDNNNFHLLRSINAEPLMLQCGCRNVALH